MELNIPDNMVARGTEELPMAMDIRGRLLDKNETISEIKVTLDLGDGTLEVCLSPRIGWRNLL